MSDSLCFWCATHLHTVVLTNDYVMLLFSFLLLLLLLLFNHLIFSHLVVIFSHICIICLIYIAALMNDVNKDFQSTLCVFVCLDVDRLHKDF